MVCIMPDTFKNRYTAGATLAALLTQYADRDDVLVLALPRGGVPVGFEVARHLHAPLDVLVVRKLGVPGHPELAMGAIAGGEVRVLNRELLHQLRIQGSDVDRVVEQERNELARRELAYRGHRAPLQLRGRTIILVDDGLATGATMYAAIVALQRQHVARVVVAVPVASREAHEALSSAADEVVSVLTPELFFGVGRWYQNFDQTSDDEVRELIRRADELYLAHQETARVSSSEQLVSSRPS
jgi:predicted phosphoribosyltransferase